MEACLDRRSKTGKREDNRAQRAVQLSIRVADGRGLSIQRVKETDQENSQTVGWGLR